MIRRRVARWDGYGSVLVECGTVSSIGKLDQNLRSIQEL